MALLNRKGCKTVFPKFKKRHTFRAPPAIIGWRHLSRRFFSQQRFLQSDCAWIGSDHGIGRWSMQHVTYGNHSFRWSKKKPWFGVLENKSRWFRVLETGGFGFWKPKTVGFGFWKPVVLGFGNQKPLVFGFGNQWFWVLETNEF